MMAIIYISSISRQRGVTLLIGLILLVVMTIVASSAINISVIDTKLVSSAKDRQMAFVAAETALASGGGFIKSPENRPDCSTPAGYLGSLQTGKWWSGFDWANEAGHVALDSINSEAAYAIEAPVVGASPYTFESLSHDSGSRYNYYKVTSQGSGPGNAVTYLQSIYVLKQLTPDC